MNNKSMWDKTLDELDKVAASLHVYLLMKDDRVAGRITARATKNAKHVAFVIYASNDYRHPVYGYRRMTGWGYDKVNTGITEILADNKEQLLEGYNVKFTSIADWDIMNTWQKDFEAAGFSVIQAL